MGTDGFFLIDKEVGWTSFDVCAKIRKKLNIKKVGHTGTLDPFATGLLVVATGRCTKCIPFLEKEKKTYETTLVLGKISETLDSESEVLDMPLQEGIPSQQEIQKVLETHFQGVISQVPPQFSAVKIKGVPAYIMARSGKKVDLSPRKVEVFKVHILSYLFPELKVSLEVSAGFYVRSFARDLGLAFGGGAYCSALRRLKVGYLTVDDAEKISHITQAIDPRYILMGLNLSEVGTRRVQDFIVGRDPFLCRESKKKKF